MSFLTDVGKAVKKGLGDIGKQAVRTVKQVAPVAQFVPGLNVVSKVASVAAGLAPSKASGGSMAFPQGGFPVLKQGPTTNSLLPALAGPIGQVAKQVGGAVVGGAIGDWINRISPGGTPTGGGSCGCNGSNGRDPCTRQKMTSQPAPNATLFGGCCPPGRTLRRISLGRDICIKTPRMNPFNPAALARADRRVTTFARRAAPILKDLGFSVSSTRKLKVKSKRRR